MAPFVSMAWEETPSDGSKLLENGSELRQNCLGESTSVFTPKNKVQVSKKPNLAFKVSERMWKYEIEDENLFVFLETPQLYWQNK